MRTLRSIILLNFCNSRELGLMICLSDRLIFEIVVITEHSPDAEIFFAFAKGFEKYNHPNPFLLLACVRQ